ncbi:MAG: CoA-binding protein, partial [bacterium]
MKAFFYPESVVVVGVSRRPITVGRIILRNLIFCGYSGQVHAVGTNGGVALGRPIYNSLKEVPLPVDLAVVVTPAATVPEIARECGELGIRRMVVETAGFSELSDDRKGLEQDLLDVAQEYGIRFIGPNCIGIINTEINLVTPFIQLRENLKSGKISIVSQSGGIAKTYWDHMFAEGLHFNKITSVGNMLNVDEADLLDYLTKEDDGTETVCMYLEGFGSGRRFAQIARQSPKPIIVHKAATAEASIASAASHTTVLSNDDRVVEAVFRQSGIVRAHSMVEMFNCAKIFEYPIMRGRNLAIVTRSGGHGVIAADMAEKCGFNLPTLAPELIQEIRTELGGGVINLRNPLDLGDMYDVALLERITRLVLSSSQVDGAVLIHGYGIPQTKVTLNLVKNLKHCGLELQKPVAISMFVDSQEMAALKQRAELPLFDTPEDAVKALDVSCQVREYRDKR